MNIDIELYEISKHQVCFELKQGESISVIKNGKEEIYKLTVPFKVKAKVKIIVEAEWKER